MFKSIYCTPSHSAHFSREFSSYYGRSQTNLIPSSGHIKKKRSQVTRGDWCLQHQNTGLCCLSCHSLKWNVRPLTSKCSVIRPWGRGPDWSCIALLNSVLAHTQGIVVHQLHSTVGSSKGVATGTDKTLSVIDTGSSILAWGTGTRWKLPCEREQEKPTASVVMPWQWHFLNMQYFGKALCQFTISVEVLCEGQLQILSSLPLYTWTQHTLSYPPVYSRLPVNSELCWSQRIR